MVLTSYHLYSVMELGIKTLNHVLCLGDPYKAMLHLLEAVGNGLPIFYNNLKGYCSSGIKQMFFFHREQDKRDYT